MFFAPYLLQVVILNNVFCVVLEVRQTVFPLSFHVLDDEAKLFN